MVVGLPFSAIITQGVWAVGKVGYVKTVRSEETGNDKPYFSDTIMTLCYLYRSERHEIVMVWRSLYVDLR